MGTYTIRLENARQVSTLLDALNTQEMVLRQAMEPLRDAAALRTLRNEIQRVTVLRSLLLNTNQDSVTA